MESSSKSVKMSNTVRLGGKVIELHPLNVGHGGLLLGVLVVASDDEEQKTGNSFILLKLVPITRNILTIL